MTPTGDWTNKGNVFLDVDVWIEQESWPTRPPAPSSPTSRQHAYDVVVPAGTTALNMRPEWSNMAGNTRSTTSTCSSSRRRPPSSTLRHDPHAGLCFVAKPAAGTWQVIVERLLGLVVQDPGRQEKYTLASMPTARCSSRSNFQVRLLMLAAAACGGEHASATRSRARFSQDRDRWNEGLSPPACHAGGRGFEPAAAALRCRSDR